MARNFRSGATWLPAVVQKKLVPLTYLVKQGEGKYCRRHIDHLRPYHGMRKENAQLLENGTSYPPTSTVSNATIQMEETVPTSATTEDLPTGTEQPPEESVRRYILRLQQMSTRETNVVFIVCMLYAPLFLCVKFCNSYQGRSVVYLVVTAIVLVRFRCMM